MTGSGRRTSSARAHAHAIGQVRARELVTTPAGDLGPQDVVDWAQANLPDGLEIEVWDEHRLAEEGCGGMLAVGKGSARPPRMLIVRYRPDNPVAHVAMVGKGIVFDSGGLSLKPPEGMEHMKDDMGGAAVVLGVLGALPALSPNVAVTGYCALAENMPSGSAQRPGDVYTARNGKTVQVLNTDAEGRLVMSDALSLAAETDADAIIDVATLTGAVSHAVGRRAIGVFGNDDDLLRQIMAAAEEAGESAWHLPLWEDLREGLDSDVADLDNIAREDRGGATIAGLFLREFVDDVPWVHLDVAGAMWATHGPRPPPQPGHRGWRTHDPALARGRARLTRRASRCWSASQYGHDVGEPVGPQHSTCGRRRPALGIQVLRRRPRPRPCAIHTDPALRPSSPPRSRPVRTCRPTASATRSHDGLEVEVAVRDVHEQGPILGDRLAIHLEGLLREQVHRDAVRRERIDDQHVVAPRPHVSDRQAAIPEDDLRRR